MTQYIRHIGITLLTVFTLSLVIQSAATAYHFHRLAHNNTQSAGWFSDCKKDKMTVSDKHSDTTEIAQPLPSQPDTNSIVNIPCHTNSHLLQAEAITLYGPRLQHSFRNQITPLHSQLFVKGIADPPQLIS